MLEKEITFDRFVRGGLILMSIVLVIYMINYLSAVLIPFFVGWLLAYMLYPLVHFLQYRCHLRSRMLSIILTLIIAVAVVTGIVMLIIPPMITEFVHLKDIAVAFVEKGASNTTIPPAISAFLSEHFSKFQLDKLLNQKDMLTAIKETLPRVWSLFYQTAGIIISIVSSLIALLYMFFLLLDYERISEGWVKFVPKNKRAFALELVGDVEREMNGYFRGQSLVALGIAILFSIGFTILDFPMAIGLGLLFGILSLVPYLHGLGLIPATLMALLKAADTGQNFWLIMLSVVILFLIVQAITDMILTPKIMGKIMGLSPAIILISLSVWGYLLGIIGLIIALPLTTLLIAYYKRYVTKNE